MALEPCNEKKRGLVKQSFGDSFPNVDEIPSPAYLVIGSNPWEKRNGRTFYDNTAYYLYDTLTNGERPWTVDGTPFPRFIMADFNDFPKPSQLSFLYCQKFDTVIFDWSVSKFLGARESTKNALKFLFKLVKPGGSMIIDSVYGISTITRINGLTKEEVWQIAKLEFIDLITNALTISPEIKTRDELINEHTVAKDVYGPLIEGSVMEGRDECIIIHKPISGGRRNTRRNRKNRKQRNNPRRRTSRR